MKTILLNQTAQGGGMEMIIMLVVMFAVFYFFMIRPQQKRQKEIKKAREAMAKGDTVVTQGGIYGKIREIRDDSFIIEVDKDVKIRVDKGCVYPSAASAAQATAEQGDAKK
jgi:preprotein translocase subunit YajC